MSGVIYIYIYQGCNRIVQYSVRPNIIWQIVDIRLGTEYQYSYLVGVTEYQYSYSVRVTEYYQYSYSVGVTEYYQYSYSVGVTEYYQYSYSVRELFMNTDIRFDRFQP